MRRTVGFMAFDKSWWKQGICFEGFDCCDWPGNFTQIGFKSFIFILYDLEMRWMIQKTIGHLFLATSSLVHYFKPSVNSNWSYSLEMRNLGQNWRFLARVNVMTLKNNRAPLLCFFKLYASFHRHQIIQNEVTVWQCQFQVKIGYCFVPCDIEKQ